MIQGFALLYLLHNNDVQKKIQEELDAVCGDNLPTLADRPKYDLRIQRYIIVRNHLKAIKYVFSHYKCS